MCDFFKGWRRKIGVLTLGMACVFAAGWIRSLENFDMINFPLGKQYAIAIASWKDALAMRMGWDSDDPWNEFVWAVRDDDYCGYCDPNSTQYRFKQPIPDGAGCFVSWNLLIYGGGIGVSPPDQRAYCGMWFMIIPYPAIVVPLALLSAYLLSKPRAAKPRVEQST